MFSHSPREASDAVRKDERNATHTAYPARVVRYYADRQTVDVQVCVMREVPGEDWEEDEFEEIPEIVNIPVQWPRAGGFVITFPLKAGDYVEVICGTCNTLVFREKGGVNQPPGLVDDEFGLNGCWVRPGCYPDNRESTLSNVDTQNFVIRRETGGPAITIKPDGSVQITSGDVVAGNGPTPLAVAIADLVKSEISKAVLGHTHSVPALGTSGNGTLLAPVGNMGASNLKAT